MASNSKDSGTTFSVGDRVVLHSLKSEEGKALNGKKGQIKKAVEGRWAVKVDDQSVDEGWKNIKPENLRHQTTVGAVVIPVKGDIYVREFPVQLKERVDSIATLIEDPHGNTHTYFHYYWLPGGKMGWMSLTCADTFREQPVNSNFSSLGWNKDSLTIMKGLAVVQFTDDQPGGASSAFGWRSGVTYYEPYDLTTVKSLVRELGESRIFGHPTRDRITKGDYQRLKPMSGVKCK